MPANNEIKSLVIALGTNIGEMFDLAKLRYNRIIIMTDADVDGAHIRTLLLTLFYRHFPMIITDGHLFIAQPPLFRISKGKQFRYAFSDRERDKIIEEYAKIKEEHAKTRGKGGAEIIAAESDLVGNETSGSNNEATTDSDAEETTTKVGGVTIQRYKGLGEMNPEQLWETTMDPANRVMKLVTIDDAASADETFDILMGVEVAPRKKFIQTHAKHANVDV